MLRSRLCSPRFARCFSTQRSVERHKSAGTVTCGFSRRGSSSIRSSSLQCGRGRPGGKCIRPTEGRKESDTGTGRVGVGLQGFSSEQTGWVGVREGDAKGPPPAVRVLQPTACRPGLAEVPPTPMSERSRTPLGLQGERPSRRDHKGTRPRQEPSSGPSGDSRDPEEHHSSATPTEVVVRGRPVSLLPTWGRWRGSQGLHGLLSALPCLLSMPHHRGQTHPAAGGQGALSCVKDALRVLGRWKVYPQATASLKGGSAEPG